MTRIALALLLMVAPTALQAQVGSSGGAGPRVELSTRPFMPRGSAVLDAALLPDHGANPVITIQRRDRRRGALRGAMIGALGGGVGLAVAGLIGCPREGGITPAGCAAAFGAQGAVLGAVAGGIIGALVGAPRREAEASR